jgi:hypothetical protein
MSFSIGIIGLPNVGKSTLFKALTKKQVDASNYPFCTIDPNIGVVPVPDERLFKLSKISDSEKTLPTTIEFVDIAGLVKGAHQGEGLGNKFLSQIKEVDAICHVLRYFEDINIAHVTGKIDPVSDKETIVTELLLADLNTIENRLKKTEKNIKGKKDPNAQEEINLLKKIKKNLEQGIPANKLELNLHELNQIKSLGLLTLKPMIYAININENDIEKDLAPPNDILKEKCIFISAKLEAEIADLDLKETKLYLKELNIKKSGLDKLITKSYNILNLITFFTSGKPETRAWTVKQGATAPKAAGVIHSDFEKLFIKAEIINWENFVLYNGWLNAKEKGLVKIAGKDYIIKDGDVCYFRVGKK